MLAAAISLAAVLTATAPDDAAKKGPADLQGVWKLTAIELNGEVVEPFYGAVRLVFDGETLRYGGAEIGAVIADSKATPHTIDLTFSNPKRSYEGVYSIEGGTLKICINANSEGVKERPTELLTKDKPALRLWTFTKEKAGAEKDVEGAIGFVGLALRYDAGRKEVIVNDALEGSPAKKAGLQKDDVVLKVGGTAPGDLQSAVDSVRRTQPGQEVAIKLRRGEKEIDVTVKAAFFPFPSLAMLD